MNKNNEFSEHINQHGDGVRDIAFEVEDCHNVYKVVLSKGAIGIQEPTVVEDKKGAGKVIVATVKTYGDTRHTFIQRDQFKGTFFPNFDVCKPDPINTLLGEVSFNFIDHIVANHQDIEQTVEWYQKVLGFHKYWSIDDTLLHTEYS